MRVLITGASGMLGTDLTRAFASSFGSSNVIPMGHASLDITNRNSIESALERYQPGVLVNSAAYTNVDKAETEKELAHALNAVGPRLLSELCQKYRTRLVHFGTDQVFDGTGQRPWREEDTPKPCNTYAETKLEGDRAVLQHPHALVLRVQWLYGRAKNRFTTLKDKELFTPFSDQYGAPTWTEPLAQTTVEMVNRGIEGLFHYAYDDYASWFEVFQFVKEHLDLKVRLEPKRTQDVKLPANRPLFSVMDNRKLLAALKRSGMGSWRDDLARFLDQMVQ